MASSSRLARLLIAGTAAFAVSSSDVLGDPAHGVAAGETGGAALAADDECAAGEECGLNALQLRGVKSAGRKRPEGLPPPLPGAEDDDEEEEDDDDDKSDEKTGDGVEVAESGDRAAPWGTCGGDGYNGPKECPSGYSCQHMTEYYAQCRPFMDKSWIKYNGSDDLDAKSPAPLLTFYMYRAQANNNYPIENVNMGTLGGMMWYLHNEIVSCVYDDCDNVRRYGISRITRWKVHTRASAPLYKAGMNFGIRYAYDLGQCTGPWPCDDQFAKYGYFVGCNNLSSGFPFPDFPVYYSGAWYTLPGACSEKRFPEQSLECRKDQPGGHCKDNELPTGEGTCTYSYEAAGEIMIDELEELETSYQEFKDNDGEEYNKDTDMGVGMTFWNGLNNTEANAERVKKADALFKKKYPDMPSDEELPPPPCDFDLQKFFPEGTPTEENPALDRIVRTRLGKD